MLTKESVIEIQNTVNKISLSAAVIVFLTWTLIGILRSRLVNRVTLRFQIIIAFIDIIRHLSSYDVRVANETLCNLIGTSVNFSDHIYVAFNTLLATNAYLIFISRQRPKMTFYPLYAQAAVMYIGILNFCYYDNGTYGRTKRGFCFFRGLGYRISSRIYMLYLMEIPGVLFCGYVVFLIMFKFKKRMSKLLITRKGEYTKIQDEAYKPEEHIGKLYWRISLYPISCFITLFPFFVAMILYDFGVELPLWYVLIFRVCRRLTGTTNFFFMLYDPNFQLAINGFYGRIKNIINKKSNASELYELEASNQPSQSKRDGTWFNQFCTNEEWEIEFDDGYKMTVQDHIKYL